MIRSSHQSVRNPLWRLPAAQRIAKLPPEAREALREVLLQLSDQARVVAEASWRNHKAPMACYWKAVAVYARHAARLTKGVK
jgi:hypothetical protein